MISVKYLAGVNHLYNELGQLTLQILIRTLVHHAMFSRVYGNQRAHPEHKKRDFEITNKGQNSNALLASK